MKKRYLEIAIVLLFLAGILGLYLYNNKNNQNKTSNVKEVKLGLTEKGGADTILDFAEEKGFLDKEDIKVKRIETGSNTVALMASGEVDVVTNRMASSVTQYLNGEDIQYIGVLEKYPSIHYGVSRMPINEVKKVGIVRLGGALHISLVQVLQAHGVDTKNIEFNIVGSDSKQRMAMLESGAVDMVLITFDELKNIDKTKYVVTNPKDLYKDVYSPLGIVLTKKASEEKKAEIQSYVNVMRKATDYILKNEKEYKEFLVRKLGISQEEAEMTYKDLVNSRENLSFTPNPSDLNGVVEVVKQLAKPKQSERSMNEFVNKAFSEK